MGELSDDTNKMPGKRKTENRTKSQDRKRGDSEKLVKLGVQLVKNSNLFQKTPQVPAWTRFVRQRPLKKQSL